MKAITAYFHLLELNEELLSLRGKRDRVSHNRKSTLYRKAKRIMKNLEERHGRTGKSVGVSNSVLRRADNIIWPVFADRSDQ